MKNPKGYATMSHVSSTTRPSLPRLTLGSYLLAQLTTAMQDETQLVKHERVYNFLHVPMKLEKVPVALSLYGFSLPMSSFCFWDFSYVLTASSSTLQYCLSGSLSPFCLSSTLCCPGHCNLEMGKTCANALVCGGGRHELCHFLALTS